MSFRPLGWSSIALGAAMAIAGLLSSAPAALLVAWSGIILFALGFISLVLYRLEGPPIDERWRMRRRGAH